MPKKPLLDGSLAPTHLALMPAARDSRRVPTPVAQRRKWPRPHYSPALPWIILAAGLAISIWLSAVITDTVEDVARLRFERQADDAGMVIESRIGFYIDILHSLKALFSSQGPVSRQQFHDFVRSLDLERRYPGFDLVNFAAHVAGEDKERFEERVRKDTSLDPRGYPDFHIYPAGQRDEYFVLVYLEPMTRFKFAFGLDLGASPSVTDPQAVAASQHAARDSGLLIASGQPIRVKTARETYTGLAMRLPVYRADLPTETVAQRRAAYLGSVGAGFNVDHLMDRVLDADTEQYMRFKLVDVGPVSRAADAGSAHEQVLYDSGTSRAHHAAPIEPDAALFTRAIPIEVAGRRWEVRFSASKQAIIGNVDTLLPWSVLVGGVLSSVLMTLLFHSLASSRTRAEKLANEMTRNLRESESSLAEAHALLSDAQKLAGVGCCQYTPASGRLVWSDELYRIHGVDPDTFTPRYDAAMALVHPEDRARWDGVLSHALASGEPFTTEFRIVRPDGAIRHVRSLGEVMNDSAGGPVEVLWSVLDITEQKQTEHMLRSSAEQLTALSRRLVDIQESERRQLSRELHDRVGQNLTALSINLDILGSSLADARHAEHRARLNDSTALLESTVDSIENVMAELRPPMLDDYGLLPALHWYAKDFSNRTGIDVSVAGNESAERPAPEMEIALFRIAQEALTNVAKHAGATRVEIVLEHCSGHSMMTVTDNGVGVEAARRDTARHGLGMVTMRERSQALGGRFSVQPVAGGGTRVTIRIP
jgi:PAS domain S-box-containing protein